MLINHIKILILLATFSAVAEANDVKSTDMISSVGIVEKLRLASAEHIYEIQQNTSTLKFRVDSSVGAVWGRFRDFKGSFFMLNMAAFDKTAAIEINAESLDTNTGFIRAMLKSESFFDVEKFPSIHFTGSSIEWYGKTHAVMKGEMTIQKTTLPVAFYVELVKADGEAESSDRITVNISTTIKRSEFGLYSLLSIVSDNVNIFMSVDALKKDAV